MTNRTAAADDDDVDYAIAFSANAMAHFAIEIVDHSVNGN